MFGFDVNIIAFVGLTVIAAGAVAYTFLFDRVSNENTQEKRIRNIRGIDEKKAYNADLSKAEDSAKRRQIMQKSLQDLEEKTVKRVRKLPSTSSSNRLVGKLVLKNFTFSVQSSGSF